VNRTSPAVASAIAHHLQSAVSLMVAPIDPVTGQLTKEAEILAKLDLVLAKLNQPAVPLDDQLWTLKDVANYLHRHVATVSESMASLPSFPRAVRLPGRGGGRGKPLYSAGEIVKWAHTFKEKR
jgi:hypothetical protein